MKRPAADLADAYARRLKSLEATRQKVEKAFLAGALARRDVDHFYEALFLSTYTAFEGLLEDLFYGLLLGRLGSRVQGVRSRINVISPTVAREIVLNGSQYTNWLPYKNTESTARLFLVGGRPFTMLDNGKKSTLQQCHDIRNVIAHKSKSAYERYNERVLGGILLPSREKTPAGFLRSQFRVSPAQCRYENYAAQLLIIARELCQ